MENIKKNVYYITEQQFKAPRRLFGNAVEYVKEDSEGRMWIGNGEYETQVNFCPFTGKEALTEMKLIEITEYEGKIYK
jgi:hypothetical protein